MAATIISSTSNLTFANATAVSYNTSYSEFLDSATARNYFKITTTAQSVINFTVSIPSKVSGWGYQIAITDSTGNSLSYITNV